MTHLLLLLLLCGAHAHSKWRYNDDDDCYNCGWRDVGYVWVVVVFAIGFAIICIAYWACEVDRDGAERYRRFPNRLQPHWYVSHEPPAAVATRV